MFKWITVVSIGLAGIVAGVIYAFVPTTSHSTASTTASNTLATNSSVKNSPDTTPGNVTITIDPTEYVSDGTTQTHSSQPTSTNVSSSTSLNTVQSTITGLTVDEIQHLHVHSDQGGVHLDIDYHSDPNGNVHLDSHSEKTNIHLTGDKAKQEIKKLMSSYGLLNVLQRMIANPTASIRIPFQHLEMQTTDGTHFDLTQNGKLHIG